MRGFCLWLCCGLSVDSLSFVKRDGRAPGNLLECARQTPPQNSRSQNEKSSWRILCRRTVPTHVEILRDLDNFKSLWDVERFLVTLRGFERSLKFIELVIISQGIVNILCFSLPPYFSDSKSPLGDQGPSMWDFHSLKNTHHTHQSEGFQHNDQTERDPHKLTELLGTTPATLNPSLSPSWQWFLDQKIFSEVLVPEGCPPGSSTSTPQRSAVHCSWLRILVATIWWSCMSCRKWSDMCQR